MSCLVDEGVLRNDKCFSLFKNSLSKGSDETIKLIEYVFSGLNLMVNILEHYEKTNCFN